MVMKCICMMNKVSNGGTYCVLWYSNLPVNSHKKQSFIWEILFLKLDNVTQFLSYIRVMFREIFFKRFSSNIKIWSFTIKR